MLLQRVVHDIVVQEGQVVVEGDWSAAGAGGRVLVQLFVMREVLEDFVVVCLRLRAGAAAVPEDQFLFRLVTQPQVRHVEVHLLQQAAPGLHRQPLPLSPPLPSASFASPAAPSTPSPSFVSVSLRLPSGVCRSPLSLLPRPPGAPSVFGRPPESTNGGLDKVHHVVKLLWIRTRVVI